MGPFAGALGWQGASRMGGPVCILASSLAVAASRSAELRHSLFRACTLSIVHLLCKALEGSSPG